MPGEWQIDPKLMEMLPQVHDLLGCDFGTKISVPGVDDKKCLQQAERYVVLYQNGKPLPQLKFCAGHLKFIETQSTERQPPG